MKQITVELEGLIRARINELRLLKSKTDDERDFQQAHGGIEQLNWILEKAGCEPEHFS
jgi:hypothetical protein